MLTKITHDIHCALDITETLGLLWGYIPLHSARLPQSKKGFHR